MKSAAHIYKKAELLKAEIEGDIWSDKDNWCRHSQLQELYRELLTVDLEHALDKKVEAELWCLFKNQLNQLQVKSKDKRNNSRSEAQLNLIWYLDFASGFYFQLLEELCDLFDLDLPCRRPGSVYGFAPEIRNELQKISELPQRTSCLYICQDCLVHLGDIARYRAQNDHAEVFYRQAAELVPSSGQPYNQLAIIDASKNDSLSMVFHYVRSIAVKSCFPVASTNLHKFFVKISNESLHLGDKKHLSVAEYELAFLQFCSFIHLCSDFDKASQLSSYISSNLINLVATERLSTWKLIQMAAICLYCRNNVLLGSENLQSNAVSIRGSKGDCNQITKDISDLTNDEKIALDLLIDYIASMLSSLLLLVYTVQDNDKLRAHYTLPVIKILLDGIKQDPVILEAVPFCTKLQIWPSLCHLLNRIQLRTGEEFFLKHKSIPLSEDWNLRAFLPLHRAHRALAFKESSALMSEDLAIQLRTKRLVDHGLWISKHNVNGKSSMKASAENGITNFEPLTHIEMMAPGDMLIKIKEEADTVVTISEDSLAKDQPTVNNTDPARYSKIKAMHLRKPITLSSPEAVEMNQDGGTKTNENRQRRIRQNVALQSIVKNFTNERVGDSENAVRLKSDSKQVTFKNSGEPYKEAGNSPGKHRYSRNQISGSHANMLQRQNNAFQPEPRFPYEENFSGRMQNVQPFVRATFSDIRSMPPLSAISRPFNEFPSTRPSVQNDPFWSSGMNLPPPQMMVAQTPFKFSPPVDNSIAMRRFPGPQITPPIPNQQTWAGPDPLASFMTYQNHSQRPVMVNRDHYNQNLSGEYQSDVGANCWNMRPEVGAGLSRQMSADVEVPSTYSLFNSTWTTGLNFQNTASGSGANFDNRSIWKASVGDPLMQLLEQQNKRNPE